MKRSPATLKRLDPMVGTIVAQTVSPRREFKRKGKSRIEGEEADWRLLIARPPAGAREMWGKSIFDCTGGGLIINTLYRRLVVRV